MRDILILGTGVHSIEMTEIIDRINRDTPAWNLLGLIDRSDDAAEGEVDGIAVLGPPSEISRYPSAMLAVGNEWPRKTALPEMRLATLIDPTAFVSRTASIGAGSVLFPGCFVGRGARLATRVFCLSGCVINHDARIGEGVVMASGVTLAGSVQVDSGCYLGQSCTVRQFVRIGRGSLIGMGSVVVSDVPSGAVMAGNPARWFRNADNDW